MNEAAQAGLVALFRVLVSELRDGELFNVFRYSTSGANIRVAEGADLRSRLSVEMEFRREDLAGMDEALARRHIASLLDRLRRRIA